ncbi:ATP-binding protein [Alishewanella longhuensis]
MTKQHPAFTLWQWLAIMLAAILMWVGAELLVRYEQQRLQAEQLQQQLTIADKLRAQLETELNIPLYLTVGLASYITAKAGQVEDDELNILLPGLIRQAKHIRNIGIAPGNRINYIFPLAGNEQALHLYYPDLTEQWPVIADIITKRSARLAGPIVLRQGGTAFVYRYPIFMADDSYWGIISTVIDIEPIWRQLAENTARLGITIALRNRLEEGGFSNSFFGDNRLFQANNLLLNLAVRGADWQMALSAPEQASTRLWLLRAFLYITGLVMLLLLCRLFHTLQRLKLSSLALRDNEQTLRSIHDNVLDGIMTVDNAGIIQTANQSCYRLLGYGANSLPGQPWSILLAPSEQAIALPTSSTLPQIEIECRAQRASGEIFDLLLSHSTLPLHRKPRHLLVLRDITERKRVERLQSDFVATVSHELRTPLTAINGALGLAVGGALGELSNKQLKILQLAQQSCTQLHQLVNDLLDFEKLHSGNMPFTITPITIDVLIAQCIAQLTANQTRQITLQNPGTPHGKVLADEVRLRQVILNLLSNALKFSAPDTPIMVELTPLATQLKVSVIDQGKGVPAAFEPLLFNRFAQANSAAVREQGGTGLGLAICKEIIAQLHGEIGYQRLAHGSCFYFTLPLAKAEPD